jgi:hypothetical protein
LAGVTLWVFARLHPFPSARPFIALATAVDPPVFAPLDQGENDDQSNQETHNLNRLEARP